jgi:hypothetical protein
MTTGLRVHAFVSMLVISCLALVGCSMPKATNKALAPSANIFAADIAAYNANVADPATKSQVDTQLSQFTASVNEGNPEAVATVWFGVGNLRNFYVTQLSADPRRQDAGGESWYIIKSNSVDAFDYVLTVGREQTAKAATTR